MRQQAYQRVFGFNFQDCYQKPKYAKNGRKEATFPVYYYYFYFQNDKYATQTIKKKICAVFGEGSVNDRNFQKLFAKFQLEISS